MKKKKIKKKKTFNASITVYIAYTVVSLSRLKSTR